MGIAASLINLGSVACRQGNLDVAQGYLVAGLQVSRDIKLKFVIAYALEAFAELAQLQAHLEHAAQFYGAAHTLREAMKVPLLATEQREQERHIATLRATLGEEAYEANYQQGGRLASRTDYRGYACDVELDIQQVLTFTNRLGLCLSFMGGGGEFALGDQREVGRPHLIQRRAAQHIHETVVDSHIGRPKGHQHLPRAHPRPHLRGHRQRPPASWPAHRPRIVVVRARSPCARAEFVPIPPRVARPNKLSSPNTEEAVTCVFIGFVFLVFVFLVFVFVVLVFLVFIVFLVPSGFL